MKRKFITHILLSQTNPSKLSPKFQTQTQNKTKQNGVGSNRLVIQVMASNFQELYFFTELFYAQSFWKFPSRS